MVQHLPHGKKKGHEAPRTIGELPPAVGAEAAKAVEVVKHGQSETAAEVKKLEVERLKERIAGLKDRLEEIAELAVAEGCPDPRAKKKSA
jgi:hypothetical protein